MQITETLTQTTYTPMPSPQVLTAVIKALEKATLSLDELIRETESTRHEVYEALSLLYEENSLYIEKFFGKEIYGLATHDLEDGIYKQEIIKNASTHKHAKRPYRKRSDINDTSLSLL